ncbi:MAG: NIPSNAP family protein [Chthoniobacterales bacterium]
MIVEIRSYQLKAGAWADFQRLFRNEALPMLQGWQVDVVAFGSSLHDANAYFLIRAYRDLAHRQQSQDEFYGSDEWRQGPRAAILECIESFTDTVVAADGELLAALRRLNASSEA